MMTSLEFLVFTRMQQEYHRQAEHHRLLKLMTASRPTTAGKLMSWTGRRLVALGERMQAQTVPPVVVSKSHV